MTEGTVRDVALRAAAWTGAHRNGFTLGTDALDAHGDVNRCWKPLGELAQVCVCVLRHTAPGDPLHGEAAELVDFAWRQTHEGALLLDLLRLEPFGTYPLEVYAAFASAGLRHRGFEEFSGSLVRTRNWRLTEQQPNRRLGVLNSERRSGFAPHRPVPEALAGTWLGGLPEPWTFEGPSGYTLTHVVFHLTDWGGDVTGVPHEVADYLALWLPAWLDSCLEDEQWDLACELVATAAVLPAPPGPWLDGVWRRLARAQDAGGAVPEVGATRHGTDGADAFGACYHSTLMALFAGVLTLRRASSPRAADATAGSGTGGTEGAPV